MFESLQNHGINNPPIHWWRPVFFGGETLGAVSSRLDRKLPCARFHRPRPGSPPPFQDGWVGWGFHSHPKLDGLLENPKITWMWGYSPFQETSIWFWRNLFLGNPWQVIISHQSEHFGHGRRWFPLHDDAAWGRSIFYPADLSPWFHKWYSIVGA